MLHNYTELVEFLMSRNYSLLAVMLVVTVTSPQQFLHHQNRVRKQMKYPSYSDGPLPSKGRDSGKRERGRRKLSLTEHLYPELPL